MPPNRLAKDYDQSTSFARRPLTGLQTGDGGNTLGPMNERVSKLEGAQDGLKQSQSILLTALGIFAAIFIGLIAVVATFQVFTFQKVDALSDQLSQLPDKIESRLQNIATTLSSAITAAKQQPPQIILMPVPPQPLPQSTPQK